MSAACDCRKTRPAIAIIGSRRRWPPRREKLGVEFRFNTVIDGLNADATRVTGVATSAGVLTAGCVRDGAGELSLKLLRAARRRDSGLSGEGLFDHGPDR